MRVENASIGRGGTDQVSAEQHSSYAIHVHKNIYIKSIGPRKVVLVDPVLGESGVRLRIFNNLGLEPTGL